MPGPGALDAGGSAAGGAHVTPGASAAGSSGSTPRGASPTTTAATSSASTPSTRARGRETEQGAGHSAHPRFVPWPHGGFLFRHREQGRHDGDPERAQPGPEGDRAALRLQGRRRLDRVLGREGRHEGELGRPRQGGARGLRVEAHQAQRAAQVSGCRKALPSGKEYRIEANFKQGISSEDAKKISKIIRDEAPKSIKSQIQGDELRVTSKSRDDLQATMALLRGKDLDVALQFVNFR